MRKRLRALKKKRPGDFNGLFAKYFAFTISYFLVFIIGATIASVFFLLLESKPWKRGQRTRTVIYSPKRSEIDCSKIHSLNQLFELSPEELETADIALINLLCAQGLKGAENLDIDQLIKQLDQWALMVGEDIEGLLPKYHEHPEQYDHSENMFRAVTMCYGLKHLFKIHYNLENMESMDYSDSSQIFIHGLLSDKRHGSCVSLPVLCVAVGRRLGYPLKLVETGLHLFLRWEGQDERFNTKVACPGVQTPPDEEYKLRPKKLSELELQRGRFLKSFTAADALSFFLTCRGHNLTDCDRICEAQVAFANAYRYSPDYVNNLIPLAATVDTELKRMWEEDCELMKTKNVRYSSWSGLRIDKQRPTWTYPPLPTPEFLRELQKARSDLAKVQFTKQLKVDDIIHRRQILEKNEQIHHNAYPQNYRQNINNHLQQQKPHNENYDVSNVIQQQTKPSAITENRK